MDTQNPRTINILLLEDKGDFTGLLQNFFNEFSKNSLQVKNEKFELYCADKFPTALAHISSGKTDLVLLDLSFGNEKGTETYVKIHDIIPETPIILLVGAEDAESAAKALSYGAYDFLDKKNINSDNLLRSIKYALERRRLIDKLRNLAFIDELTNLYSREGFTVIGSKISKLVQRIGTGMFILLADFRNLKYINETLGYDQGNFALIDTAEVLKKSFRDSDVIARIGEDEFAVLGVETARVRAEILTNRLVDNFKNANINSERSYKLCVDTAVVRCEPESISTMDELLTKAFNLMIENKNNRR